MKPIKIITLLLTLSACGLVSAQNATDLRINEVMVFNDSNVVDDYGNHVGWIEIYNTSYNTVNIGGLFLTDDAQNPIKSMIAKNHPQASIPPRSHFIMYATGDNSTGLRHLTFKLECGKTLYLFDGNGRTLLDSVKLPASMKADISYGRETDGADKWVLNKIATPAISNNHTSAAAEIDEFKKLDPFGVGMAAIAMTIVLSSLATLYFCFKLVGKIATRKKKHPFTAKNAQTGEAATDEVNAAIALALFLHSKQEHDEEYTVLTMRKVSRNYSPWSSKIYGMRKRPGGLTSY